MCQMVIRVMEKVQDRGPKPGSGGGEGCNFKWRVHCKPQCKSE